MVVKKGVISEKKWIVMGVIGSYQPWKKDNQAMRGTGKLGQIGGYSLEGVRVSYGSLVYGPIEEMGESRKAH